MLVLARHTDGPDNSIIIGECVTVVVLGVRGTEVRLGITAPLDIRVDRTEVRAAKDRRDRARWERDLLAGRNAGPARAWDGQPVQLPGPFQPALPAPHPASLGGPGLMGGAGWREGRGEVDGRGERNAWGYPDVEGGGVGDRERQEREGGR